MARGPASPAPNALPKVSFTKIEDRLLEQPAGVHDQQARSYGYNDFSSFQRPESYIRYIEPLESELAVQVEYDMDEQDQEWLDALNLERKHDQLDKISYETFEIVMDRLEKEWFDLTKNIPKPDLALPSEDSTCAICDDAEGENANAIVFCDGCNLAVHQDCYGVPYIPEGQWLCRKCTVCPETSVACTLCPNEGGAFKQTIHGEWIHLLCAIWVPETRVANDIFMEPIMGLDRINKQRWKLKCSICGIREGACIQCTKSSCFLAFHATCARRQKLLMPMKSAHGAEPATLACYCEKHLPEEQQAAHQAALEEIEKEKDNSSGHTSFDVHTLRSSKKARAYAKSYKLGPPLVPAIIVRNIVNYIAKIPVRKKLEFVHLVCKYWSLKREARRGAPLLKRLYLEPWNANNAGKHQTDEEKFAELDYLKVLRADLERLRMLADLLRKREALKLQQAQIVYDVCSKALFPDANYLRQAFEKITAMDRNDYFKLPVSKADVPDYFDVIEKPMCWNMIENKLEGHEYSHLGDFEDDVNIVFTNAMTYNKADSPIYRAAQRIKKDSALIFEQLRSLIHSRTESMQPEGEQTVKQPTPESSKLDSPTGDLEPPLSVAQLLLSNTVIREDSSVILEDSSPLVTLLKFEFGKFKEHPIPAPTSRRPPPRHKPKRERNYQLEKERRNARLALQHLDYSPGFLMAGRQTRRTAAAVAAFEAEAGAGANTSTTSIMEIEEKAENTSAPPPSKRSKRPSMVLPGQTDVPPVVDEVDAQISFKMFDGGWILPETQRRGGRLPPERRVIHLPAKRVRDRPKSRASAPRSSAQATPSTQDVSMEDISLVSAQNAEPGRSIEPIQQHASEGPESAPVNPEQDIVEQKALEPRIVESPLSDLQESEASKPRTGSAEVTAAKDPAKDASRNTEDVKMEEVDATQADATEAGPPFGPSRPHLQLEISQIITGPSRVVIEQLDTPATRRAKSQAKKQKKAAELAEQQRLAEAAATLSGGLDDSDLSSLSSLDEADAEGQTPETPLEKKGPKRKSSTARNQYANAIVNLKPGEMLKPGTIVWAKCESYPWWPARVWEKDSKAVPENVLASKKKVDEERPPHLVRFYDNRSSWQWAGVNHLKLLGEDQDLDDTMLKNSKIQRFKANRVKFECRSYYKKAMVEKEKEESKKQESDESASSIQPVNEDVEMTTE